MRRVVVAAGVVIATCGWALSAEQAKISIETLPAVVVKTVPQSGDTKVAPSITEIQVTFSKRMLDKTWSWSQISNDSFPPVTGKPRYLADRKTCVLPVKLEPRKTYAIWLNSGKFGNFKDTKGQPSVPYLLVFETGEQ